MKIYRESNCSLIREKVKSKFFKDTSILLCIDGNFIYGRNNSYMAITCTMKWLYTKNSFFFGTNYVYVIMEI